MELNQIRYFLALTETLNFTQAAELCHVSQPALTQSIKRLESELGGQLIERNGRETKTTKLGNSLIAYFEKIEHTKKLAMATARAVTDGDIAVLNIGVMCSLGPRLLAIMVNKFQKAYPQISLVLHDVKADEIGTLLFSGKIDGAFCSLQSPAGFDYQTITLFEERMMIAFPDNHDFSRLDAIPLKAIAEHRYVDRTHCEIRQLIFDYFDSRKIKIDIVFSSKREDWVQSLIRDGVGVSIIPEYSLLQPELKHRRVVKPELVRSVQFAYLKHTVIKPALQKFITRASTHKWFTPACPEKPEVKLFKVST